MDITPVTSPTDATTNAAQNSLQSPLSNVAEQFDTFLKLLTAQVRNQDPLAPLDSTQFVEQLATFSSLEQQVQTNTLLQSLSQDIKNMVHHLDERP